MSERKARGLHQELYIIEAIANSDEYTRQFAVMGSTGNVYTVSIKSSPTCTCPDYILRKNRCKHIFFILIRAMKVTNEDKKKYSKDDLKKMFKNIPKIASNLIADEEINELYKSAKTGTTKEDVKVEMKGADDICPICLDDLTNGEIDYCKYSCGKCVHKKCFEMYARKNTAICVFCRAEWKPKKSKEKKGGYINLLAEEEFEAYPGYRKYSRRYKRYITDDDEEEEELEDEDDEEDELENRGNSTINNVNV
jgi:hypothetical protein